MRRRVFNPGDEVAPVNADAEVGKLRQQLRALEREVAMLTRELPRVDQAPSEDAGPVNRDARWHCQKCGYLLGFYDVGQDVLRTRYKEHIVFVRCGEGGFVQVVCRGCSEVNTATGEGAPTPDREAQG
jgi:hypothetical protein